MFHLFVYSVGIRGRTLVTDNEYLNHYDWWLLSKKVYTFCAATCPTFTFFGVLTLHKACHIFGYISKNGQNCWHIITRTHVDEGGGFSKLTSWRLIHLPQPVPPPPPFLPSLLPASLFSIKCQDWPFYNHICDLGSGIQMQSMSIRITMLLIERGEMVWANPPIFILAFILIYIVHVLYE